MTTHDQDRPPKIGWDGKPLPKTRWDFPPSPDEYAGGRPYNDTRPFPNPRIGGQRSSGSWSGAEEREAQ